MQDKHTPGPWAWAHRQIPNGNYSTQVYDAAGQEIATIAWYPVRVSDTRTSSCREHNARLIAAVPELLDALLEYDHAFHNLNLECKESRVRMLSAVDKARAAIAKATGA